MSQTYVTNLQLRLLWHKAEKAGFTKQGLRHMVNHVGLNREKMSVKQYDTLLTYVNVVNAKKFR